MPGGLKTSAFTVRATEKQSIRWKRAADAEGHASAGTWLAEAADRYLDALQRAGKPLPLAWRRSGLFRVCLMDGREIEVTGRVSAPFAVFRGNPAGPGYKGCRLHSLVFIPQGRILATLRSEKHCKALASDLARLWVRWGGNEPAEDPAPIVERHRRADA